MDELYFQSLESEGLLSKADSLISKNYNSYISEEDPTRLKWNIATSFDDLVFSTILLYDLAVKMGNFIVEREFQVKGSSLASRSYGKVMYKGGVYLLVFYSCPIRVIPGTTFNCPVPIRVNLYNSEGKDISSEGKKEVFSLKSKEKTSNLIPLLIPLSSPNYVIYNKLNALICPGAVSFTHVLSKNVKTVIGVYTPLDQREFIYNIQDENLLLGELSHNWEFVTPDEVINYLTAYHTRITQAGYYAPTNSLRGQVFLKYGDKFNTAAEKESYYENLLREEENVMSLPLYEYPKAEYLTLYCNKSCFKTGLIKKPLFLNVIPNILIRQTFKVLVDIRTLDINFIWNEKVKQARESLPETGCYALSKSDTRYLEYYTHSSGILVAVFGYMDGNTIYFEPPSEEF
jgi:hypothetical protein